METGKNFAGYSRRRFLARTVRNTTILALLVAGLGIYGRQTRALPAYAIRPPGALDEADFVSACIRCGLCVRDCPFDILHLAELGDRVTLGTPFFVARQAPCEMCEDIPCVKACPTGALEHGLTQIDDAKMGLAALVDEENCLNFLGLRCDVCYRVCPLIDKAITLVPQHNPRTGRHTLFIPVVHSDSCTGCGKCEHACVLPKAAIKVLPSQLAKGEAAEHYRLGWEEKQRAGESLVTPDKAHRYNLPEGYQYEHEGQGLREPATSIPYSDSPLDTLNRHREQF